MRFSSSEPTGPQPAQTHASVAQVAHVLRFSPAERIGAREPSGAVTAEIAAASRIEDVMRAEPAMRDEVAVVPAAR